MRWRSGACGRRTSPDLSGLGAGFVVDFGAVVRVPACLEKVFDQVHGVIQKVVVRFADLDVDLALFGPNREQDLNAEDAEVFAKVAEEYFFAVIRGFTDQRIRIAA